MTYDIFQHRGGDSVLVEISVNGRRCVASGTWDACVAAMRLMDGSWRAK